LQPEKRKKIKSKNFLNLFSLKKQFNWYPIRVLKNTKVKVFYFLQYFNTFK
jgi:hypothetical protein